jgi:predicted transcriptional regulator
MGNRRNFTIMCKAYAPGLAKFFGRLEAEVMKIVWTQNPITVKRVLYFINKNNSYAYTTIMTIMNRLTGKNLLTREKKGHSYQYSPTIGEEEFLTLATEEIIGGLLDDFPKITSKTITRLKKKK